MTIAPEVLVAAFGTLVTALGAAARMIYVDLRKDRDYWRDDSLMWRDLALTGTKMAEKSTEAALREAALRRRA